MLIIVIITFRTLSIVVVRTFTNILIRSRFY